MDKIQYIKSKLEPINIKNCKTKFGLFGQRLFGKCIKVIDGDSICVAICYPDLDSICKVNLRLYGIDTPEKSSSDPKEKQAAIDCKNFVTELILNQFIWVNFENQADKYGRWLATLYHYDQLDFEPKYSINQKILLNPNLHCKPYFGNKKESWSF